ncbi:DUF4240 domain-containing protein [Streptomyces polyrhachis]|uniref:DUF4240 domain-containing protein n=1 Tax=Streptomyces polyrhachis TaxID=1282885 RepID=A0ABW2GK47_9ACTN
MTCQTFMAQRLIMDMNEFWELVESARASNQRSGVIVADTLIGLGRDWYERAAAAPDSLADHPAVIEAAASGSDEAVFLEAINYVASDAFARQTGDVEDFYLAWDRYHSARQDSSESQIDMGKDFDFDDVDEMRRRLPQLTALFYR